MLQGLHWQAFADALQTTSPSCVSSSSSDSYAELLVLWQAAMCCAGPAAQLQLPPALAPAILAKMLKDVSALCLASVSEQGCA